MSAAFVAVTKHVPLASFTFKVVPSVMLQPVDEPTENVDVVIDTNLDNYNPMDIFKSSWFQVIAGSLAFFILLCVLNVLFGAFEHKTELTESAAAASGGFSLSSMFKKK